MEEQAEDGGADPPLGVHRLPHRILHYRLEVGAAPGVEGRRELAIHGARRSSTYDQENDKRSSNGGGHCSYVCTYVYAVSTLCYVCGAESGLCVCVCMR